MQVEQTVQQAEAILRFTEEVDRRFAEHGIASMAEFLQRYAEVESALASLSASELEWASGEADRLLQRLQKMGTELQHLTALKSAFEVRH
ncbi:MAG TPA: hypothetical protein VFD92_06395 [Candidatus Binatia bacterium]|nr:hypothetical protein [Candidatus Binatia bacterium]